MVLCKRTVDYHHVRSDQFEDGQLLETKSSNGKILVTVYNSADNRVSDVIIGVSDVMFGEKTSLLNKKIILTYMTSLFTVTYCNSRHHSD